MIVATSTDEPLPPATIEELTQAILILTGRIIQLEQLMQVQGDINGKLLSHMTVQQLEKAQAKSPLILPDRLNS